MMRQPSVEGLGFGIPGGCLETLVTNRVNVQGGRACEEAWGEHRAQRTARCQSGWSVVSRQEREAEGRLDVAC